MARRVRSAGRRTQSTVGPTGTTNFDLLGLYGDNRTRFSFLEGIDSANRAFADMETVASDRTSDGNLTTAIANGERLGVIWRLLDIRSKRSDDPWTVDVGEDHPLKIEHLVPIRVASGTKAGQLPATGRGVVQTMIHQRDLVVWNNDKTNGKILFIFLRANQRALLTSFSVQHLGTCARIYDARPNALNAVKWVRGALEDGKIEGTIRRAEGLEYVATCIRIHNAYLTATRRKSATEEQGLEAAQNAIAPRGGARDGGASPTQMMQRMTALSAHLLATMARAGISSPFLTAIPNTRALGWFVDGDYSDDEQAIYDEVNDLETEATPWQQVSFPTASSFYRFTVSMETGVRSPQPESANTVRVPAGTERTFPWHTALLSGSQQSNAHEEITRSERSYASAARAMAYGKRTHPTAEEAFDAPDRIRTVEVTENGQTRWVWERVLTTGRAPIITFGTREEAEAELERRRNDLDNPEIREIQGEGGDVIYGVFGRTQRQIG